MIYKLDDINISEYGSVPITGPLTSEWISLEDVFSMPSRTGTTEYNWGTSIEPFVEAHEIVLDGKTLVLHLMVRGATDQVYASNLNALLAACATCRKLSTNFGDFAVLVKDEVKVKEHINHRTAFVSIPLWTPWAPSSDPLPPGSGGGGYRLDTYNLRKDFGIVVAERSGNRNLGKRIEVSTTHPYTQTAYRDLINAGLRCQLLGDNLLEIYTRMMHFQRACTGTGLHTLTLPNGSSYTGYVKDGFKATATCGRWVTFDFKFRVV